MISTNRNRFVCFHTMLLQPPPPILSAPYRNIYISLIKSMRQFSRVPSERSEHRRIINSSYALKINHINLPNKQFRLTPKTRFCSSTEIVAYMFICGAFGAFRSDILDVFVCVTNGRKFADRKSVLSFRSKFNQSSK